MSVENLWAAGMLSTGFPRARRLRRHARLIHTESIHGSGAIASQNLERSHHRIWCDCITAHKEGRPERLGRRAMSRKGSGRNGESSNRTVRLCVFLGFDTRRIRGYALSTNLHVSAAFLQCLFALAMLRAYCAIKAV